MNNKVTRLYEDAEGFYVDTDKMPMVICINKENGDVFWEDGAVFSAEDIKKFLVDESNNLCLESTKKVYVLGKCEDKVEATLWMQRVFLHLEKEKAIEEDVESSERKCSEITNFSRQTQTSRTKKDENFVKEREREISSRKFTELIFKHQSEMKKMKDKIDFLEKGYENLREHLGKENLLPSKSK